MECMGDRGDGYPLDCMTTKAPVMLKCEIKRKTRSSWLNCALRDDEPVYCVSIGHYEAGTVGN